MNLSVPSLRSTALALGLVLAVVGTSVLTSVAYEHARPTQVAKQPADNYKLLNEELAKCIDRASAVTVGKPSLDDFTRIWHLCENQMYDQLLLNDFSIRRQKFEENGLDERVNLWLVVVITLSGVVLAALQLLMSYRLSAAAKSELAGGGDLAIEQGKLSLKSSVTGLMIMALSLVFFVVYVKFIYQNFDVATERPDNLKASPQAGRLVSGTGALGWGAANQAKPPEPVPSIKAPPPPSAVTSPGSDPTH